MVTLRRAGTHPKTPYISHIPASRFSALTTIFLLSLKMSKAIDLKSIKLVVVPPERIDFDDGDDSDDASASSEAYSTHPWLKTVEIEIKSGNTKLGWSAVQLIDRRRMFGSFHSLMDGPSQVRHVLSVRRRCLSDMA